MIFLIFKIKKNNYSLVSKNEILKFIKDKKIYILNKNNLFLINKKSKINLTILLFNKNPMLGGFFEMFNPQIDWYLKPIKYSKDSENNYSSKVLLPYYVLAELVAYNYQPPYLFKIGHSDGSFTTVCSVLDFQLDKNEVHIPAWMYEQLCLDQQKEVVLKHVKLSLGMGIKLLPHDVSFLNIENPRKALEEALKNYHVLSFGDEIKMNFEEIGPCRFTVTKIYPENKDSIYIVDTDLNVEFDEPIGYKEYIEDQKTAKKHIKINKINDIEILELDGIGYFCDWDAL